MLTKVISPQGETIATINHGLVTTLKGEKCPSHATSSSKPAYVTEVIGAEGQKILPQYDLDAQGKECVIVGLKVYDPVDDKVVDPSVSYSYIPNQGDVRTAGVITASTTPATSRTG